MNNSLPWPEPAEVLPLTAARPVLDRLSSLVTTHAQDTAPIPGLAVTEEEVAADPPPALEQIGDELGGIVLRGRTVLTLQIEDRTDEGPYTLLGEATTYYPLYETEDSAVILALGEDGTAGAVHGIGEDLALRLAAADLPTYLDHLADALEATLTALAARGPAEEDVESERDEAAAQLMDQHLFAALLGTDEAADGPEVPWQVPSSAGIADLPPGTLAVADLRAAPVGARADLMEVEAPGDPLDLRVAWRERGLVVALLGG